MQVNPFNKALIGLLAVLTLVILWFGYCWGSFLVNPLIAPDKPGVELKVVYGSSAVSTIYQLQELGLIKHPIYFIALIKLTASGNALKAGEYLINPGTTPIQLLKKMLRGEVIPHNFTIIEGWTFVRLLNALASDQHLRHTVAGLREPQIMNLIGHSGEMAEGRFAPDTYKISSGASDVDVLNAAYDLMNTRLRKTWDERSALALYPCPYDALVVASIIEKETAFDQEKPKIAGVIIRRLMKGMPLQLDPTVIYGLGEKFSGKLTEADLFQDTAYNTYTRRGLPPSPISMPGVSSMIAAMHPESGTELYYVAKGDGTHVFSNTLEEQNQAIKKYLLKKVP